VIAGEELRRRLRTWRSVHGCVVAWGRAAYATHAEAGSRSGPSATKH
jgi:hypothetical protein